MERMYARLEVKPDYPDASEMTRRVKEAQRRQYAMECNEMIQAKSYDAAFIENRRERKARTRRSIERRLRVFFRDLDYFIDLCIARFLVWRETRRK